MPKNKEGRKICDCHRFNALPYSVRDAAPYRWPVTSRRL
nr:MAG TPA: hypothetical protein [Caudoviricetes sp.]DAW72280.1 MAG TPA: hypothetical protein [Caudoviricetes sp.]